MAIIALMGKRNKEQINTTYTYIPSHIEEKTARYTAWEADYSHSGKTNSKH